MQPVGEVLGLVHVVRRQENRLAELLQALDHRPRLAPRGWIEAGRRLVEEHQLRIADQPERDVDATLLAPGEPGDPRPPLLREPDELDRLVRAAGDLA